MASPCPMSKNATVKIPRRSSTKTAYQIKTVVIKRVMRIYKRPFLRICSIEKIIALPCDIISTLPINKLRMKKFEEQKFNIPPLKGISAETVEEHLKLYAGYVKHANLVLEKIKELKQDAEKNAYALGEVNRRFGFEFNGMRNHEVYFRSFEVGSAPVTKNGPMYKMIETQWGSFDAWIAEFKAIALTRGIGWSMLYYDPV